jgi:predicted negative regulator of RcsB-dependent stress response
MFAQNKKQKQETPTLTTELSQKLYRIPHEITYKQYVEQVSPKQYETLDSILEYTELLSELNLVYLFTQNSLSFTSSSSNTSGVNPASQSVSQSSAQPTEAAKPAQSPALRNLNMAELFISKKQWSDAIKELITAEKLDPNNAKVYALRGLAQMNQNAAAIAKASFQKYLSQVSAPFKPPEKPPEKKGGLFGWGKK